MEAWVPYVKVLKYPPDFRVEYRLYSDEEGGRKNLTFQGQMVGNGSNKHFVRNETHVQPYFVTSIE